MRTRCAVTTRGCVRDDVWHRAGKRLLPDTVPRQNFMHIDIGRARQWGIYGGSCLAHAQIASARVDLGIEEGYDIHDYLALVR